MECGALPADCAPAKSVTRQKLEIVGNDPCVVPLRGKDTFLWGVQIYPPSSVAYATASPRGEAFLTPCEHGKRLCEHSKQECEHSKQKSEKLVESQEQTGL